MINYIVQVVCPFKRNVIFEYYCGTKSEAVWLTNTLRKTLTVEDVLMCKIAR